jgi:translation elongation factor EF-Ts
VISSSTIVLSIYLGIVEAIIKGAPKAHVDKLIDMIFRCFVEFESLLDQDFIIDYGVKVEEYLKDYDEFADAVEYWRTCRPDDYHEKTNMIQV